jgi:hypothetical protein
MVERPRQFSDDGPARRRFFRAGDSFATPFLSAKISVIPESPVVGYPMDKKARKRLEILRKRQEKLRQQLAGARSQMDDPEEVVSIEREIAEVEAEIEKLKNS